MRLDNKATPLRLYAESVPAVRWNSFTILILLGCLLLSGCSRLRRGPALQYVYVTSKQTYLRDRVAAVSNRTATVVNGDKLQILEHGRRFYHVKTAAGAIGWIDERAVATQDVYDQFQQLDKQHQPDVTVASAVVRDEVNLHLKAGRDAESLYRLAEGDKLQLIQRATLPKPVPGGAVAKPAKAAGTAATTEPAAPIAMEDWWLARDGKGRAGWLLSRMLDVDAPDTLTRYAEGQRFVAAYVLTTVYDPGAEQADKNIPVYLTVLAPYAAGLPFDFNQVRLFTWNSKMHRYETGFREKNIEGFLPVKIGKGTDPYGKTAGTVSALPTFTYRVLAADSPPVVPNPATGTITAGKTIEKMYQLEGNIARRIAPPGYHDPPAAHPEAPESKTKKPRKR